MMEFAFKTLNETAVVPMKWSPRIVTCEPTLPIEQATAECNLVPQCPLLNLSPVLACLIEIITSGEGYSHLLSPHFDYKDRLPARFDRR